MSLSFLYYDLLLNFFSILFDKKGGNNEIEQAMDWYPESIQYRYSFVTDYAEVFFLYEQCPSLRNYEKKKRVKILLH